MAYLNYYNIDSMWRGFVSERNTSVDALMSVINKIGTSVNPHTDKTHIVECEDGFLYGVKHDGMFSNVSQIMPAIVDVEVKSDDCGNPRTVYVAFADGAVEKAKLDGEDSYSLEIGVSICVTKKLMSVVTGFADDGSSLYNKVVKSGVKFYKNKQKALKEKADAEAAYTAKIKKLAAKKKARDERRASRKREEAIAIQSEAIYRAMRRMQNEQQ